MQTMTNTTHPVFSTADIARMSPAEQAFFTDTPVAHIAARADFIRQNQIALGGRPVLDKLLARAFARQGAR